MSEVKHIGVVGDGQLGRMLTQAALPLGFEVTALGMAGPNSPAAQVGARQMEGSLTDPDAIRRLAEKTDVVTWEIEHINAEVLVELASEGYNIQASPRSLQVIQDKFHQKAYLDSLGIPVAPFNFFGAAYGEEDRIYGDRTGLLNGKLIVKTRRGGYDGRGNLVLGSGMTQSDVKAHFGALDDTPTELTEKLYLEQVIPFQRELAVIGARDLAGKIALYPVVETVHKKNICHEVYAPADIDPKILHAAEDLGRETIGSFDGAGVFAVEMFQDEADNVLVNEVAPRVHNSGHYTIIGSETSQFEQHIRAIAGLPLGSTAMRASAAAMVNILGTKTVKTGEYHQPQADDPDTMEINWYGKDSRDARKIGHITVLGDTLKGALAEARQVRSSIKV